MRASELVRGLPIEALDEDFEVTGVTHDSRKVRTGDLFVALEGDLFDGRAFASDAHERGAAAVLAAGAAPADYDGPWLRLRRSDEARATMGLLAARIAEHPDRRLSTVGITGTNGKSTVIALVAAMLEAAGVPTGAVGTLGHRFRDLEIEAGRTTPEATDLYPLLAAMVEGGGRAVVMEVSSHALALERVAGMSFDVAAFLNLSRDHFDFHKDFEDYYSAKRRLFDQLKPTGRAVVNAEDDFGRRLAAELAERKTPVLTFGQSHGDVAVVEAALTIDGIEATLATPAGEIVISSPLRGRYNLLNLLAAVASGLALDIEPAAIVGGIAAQGPVPGRLEPIEAGQPFPVFLDYAHTDAALAAALRSVREIAAGREIVCVFGCGGDRDRGKRALMGRVAGELADLPIATSDNPRRENPRAILDAVEGGLQDSGNRTYLSISDRREAIRRAIAEAGESRLVLVAGKGHEEGQIVGDEVRPFSDRAELLAALEERFG